ncbi:MAG: hypothetical protein GY938_31915 [Ketobacter sp.]|nr:hypothetical protein [Ketobacter sp.]
MTETEVIKAAVELADGWYDIFDDYDNGHIHGPFHQSISYPGTHPAYPEIPQWVLAALAAQLVEQIDAMDGHLFESGGVGQALIWRPDDNMQSKIEMRGPSRTMNTLRACIDFYEVDSEQVKE